MIRSFCKERSLLKPDYPYIGRNKGLITVLFYEKQTGTVLIGNNTGDKVGNHRTNWTEHNFVPITDEIVLMND